MSFNILPPPEFSRELKKLSKKYTSIKTDLSQLLTLLKEEPAAGQPLGNNAIKSEWPYHPKIKVNSAVQELLLM